MQLASDSKTRLVIQDDVLAVAKPAEKAAVVFKASSWYSE
jgi:hypothetical protein